jgi:Family of unknown function (DUF6069)
MSAATPSTATRSTPAVPATSRLARVPVPVAGGFAALAGAAVLYAYGTLAGALDVPLRAGEIGARHAQAITPASFAAGVVFCTVAGTILAMVLARYAAHPARAFLRTSLALVAISLVFPLAASHAAASTRLTLALGHLLAAAIVIPILAGRLAYAAGRPRPFRRG